MSTSSIVNDQIFGTNINIIDTKNDSSTTVTPNVQSRNKTSAYIVNNFRNRLLSNMIENAKYENDNIMTLSLTDVDISCFTPNKQFIVSFEEKEINVKHKGNYRLSYSLFSFIKNGDFYTMNSEVRIKKTT